MDVQLNLNSEPVTAAYPADPLVVEPQCSLREVFALLKAQRTGSVLVCRDDRIVGIFTERDALRLMAEGGSLDRPIDEVMVPSPVTIRGDATVGEAIRIMSSGGYRHLPIVDDQGRPLGMLKASGIVHYLVEHFPQAIYNLPPQPKIVMQEREGA